MINVLNMIKTGVVGDIPEFKFEFEFDSASTLPVKTYVLAKKTYLIAKDSTAKNLSTNTYYRYGGIGDKWVKVLPTPTPTPVDNTKITDNGNYNLINNDFVGYNEVSVNVSDEPTVLIEKSITENGTYNASDDEANGYSSVNVNVPNSYSSTDEGKVVDNGELVVQTAMSEEVTENGTINTTLYNSVTVNVSSDGGGSSGTDVAFYDYDGSVVASYSVADFANLSAMPANPTHTGLTAQGWNWSLADAKAYVASYGKLNIGQMYITSDGKTRLYFTVTKNSLTVDLYLNLGNDTELDIDWGDNSTHTTWTNADDDNSKSHEYASAGRYVIAITVAAGSFGIEYESRDLNVYKAEIGTNVTSLGFNSWNVLTFVTIPNMQLSAFNFNTCKSLFSLTIPNGAVDIGSDCFYDCNSLSSISIPNSVNDIGESAFAHCHALRLITIPNGIAMLRSGMFQECQAFSSIIIPSDVTSIEADYFFYENNALQELIFTNSIPPEILYETLNIPTTCIIRVPQGSLSAYTSASNYPDTSNYIYEEY